MGWLFFARQGVKLSHALFPNWVDVCCQLTAPLNDALYRYVMNTRLGTIHGMSIGELLAWTKEDENFSKGEIVLITKGHRAQDDELPADALRTLTLLQVEVSLKQATALAVEIHGVKKNALYKYAQEQQGD